MLHKQNEKDNAFSKCCMSATNIIIIVKSGRKKSNLKSYTVHVTLHIYINKHILYKRLHEKNVECAKNQPNIFKQSILLRFPPPPPLLD